MANVFKVKPTSSLSNGISIGLGAAALGLGLLMAFVLNAVYNEQASYLAAYGVQVLYSRGFSDLVYLISTGVFVAVFGAYLLVVGCLSNYSERARFVLSPNDNWGNRLINGGVFGVAFISGGMVRDSYAHNPPDWYAFAVSSLLAVSLVLIITGVLLLIRIPFKSQKPAAVQDASAPKRHGETLSTNP
jgi:hypothetical protein